MEADVLLHTTVQQQQEPNMINFGAAICSDCSRQQALLGTIDAGMQHCVEQLEPNVISNKAAISKCEKGCSGQLAVLDIIDARMQQYCVGQWEPNVFSYRAVISTCEKGRSGQQALFGIIDAIMQQYCVGQLKPNVIRYNAAIQLQHCVGQWEPNVISYKAAISPCEEGCSGQQALLGNFARMQQQHCVGQWETNVIS